MKTIRLKKKLRFHKETIADLHSKEMQAAHGGENTTNPIHPITYTTCQTACISGVRPICPMC